MISLIILQEEPTAGGSSMMLFVLIIIGICLYFIIRANKRKSKKNDVLLKNLKQINQIDEKINIPDTCPHCKSLNTKRLRECEWCGNEIY
jgi:hypothetical protein